MKYHPNPKSFRLFTTLGAACLLAPAAVQAGGTNDCAYLNFEAGASIMSDVNVKSATGGGSGKLDFDTGFRGGVSFGWRFCHSLSAELETGVAFNKISSINGNTLSDFGARADLYQVPLLANVVYQPHLKHGFRPYVGFGIGGVAGVFDSESVPLSGSASNPNFNNVDFTFAYQAQAGLKFVVSKSMDFGVAYKYLGTLEHSWSDQGVTLKTDGTMTHAVVASLTWRF